MDGMSSQPQPELFVHEEKKSRNFPAGPNKIDFMPVFSKDPELEPAPGACPGSGTFHGHQGPFQAGTALGFSLLWSRKEGRLDPDIPGSSPWIRACPAEQKELGLCSVKPLPSASSIPCPFPSWIPKC